MDAPDSLVLLLTQIQGSSLFGSDIITHPSQARPMPHATPRIHPHRIRKKLLELLAIYSFRTRRCLPWMGSNRLCVRRPPGDGGSRRRRAGPGLQATVLAKGLQAPATVPAKGGSRGRQPRSPAVAHGPRLSVRLPCVLGVQPTDNNNDGERTSGRAEVRCVAHRAAVQQGVRASGGHRRLPAWFSWRPSNIRPLFSSLHPTLVLICELMNCRRGSELPRPWSLMLGTPTAHDELRKKEKRNKK